jgi:hypothetical protein
MTYVYDAEKDVARFNAVGDPFIGRIILGRLFDLYGRERVQQELIRQASSAGVVSIAAAPNWRRPRKPQRADRRVVCFARERTSLGESALAAISNLLNDFDSGAYRRG